MKKIIALFILTAITATVSFHAYAHNNDPFGFGGFNHFGYGFGYGYNFGGFGMEFAGFDGFGMTPGFGGYGMGFAGFGGFGHEFTVRSAANFNRKIVPIPATATVNTSISYDENGEIHVRPFDDEDLFVED